MGTAWFLYQHWADLRGLQRLTRRDMFGLIALRIFALALFIQMHFLLYRRLAPSLRSTEFLGLFATSFFSGQLVPLGAAALRAAYLKSRHGMRIRDYGIAQTLLALRLIGIGGLLAIIALLAYATTTGAPVPFLLWAGASACLAGGAGAVPLITRIGPSVGALRRVHSLLEKADALRRIPLWHLLVLRGLSNMAVVGWLFVILTGDPHLLLLGATIESLSIPLQVVRITSSNLGVLEWLFGALSSASGETLAVGIVVALLFRLLSIVAMMALAIVSLVLFRRSNKMKGRIEP
ncbi:MAG TPA: hypothetical protein DIW77_01430 [Chromatiaceae bacterium]|nr:MAG: hypothetical protein N838_19125 [Thiohalocapsa sp. PB-PSB1]HCS88739.1 hypothetical protein [Chromatiaceae bacterium]